ncbi:ribose transport system permease protein [Microbacterium sp. W4I4]|uniref:ABC transporter permease n=1 Tax=Microbacterium sp. W4I4 TaxID=3042295 RepID=UPI00277E23C9|nr:ABC transporter permease [Microbacterium sp. W4I4]MDQ0615120.1 ribose transport system permease protein [Microbacterium sp. W4I4]
MTATMITTEPFEEQSRRSSVVAAVRTFLARQYLVVVVLIAFFAVGLVKPAFWGAGNIQNILFETAFVGIAACGMVLLITGGLLDLSVAGILAVSAIAVGTALPHTTIGAVLVLAVAVGAVLGLANGLLVTYVKIAPFIATLGTLYLFLGMSFIWTGGSVVSVTSKNFRALTTGSIGVVPYAFIALVVLALITYFLLYRTGFGRTLRAIGSNERAAHLAGMRVNRTKVLVFVVAGICFALAGVFMAGRLSSAEANMATGLEMSVIAAVVVGGTALRGGRGTVFGTVVGALLFAVLAKALNMLGVASYWQYVVTGSVLVIAVAVGARRRSAAEVRGAG